MPKPKNSECNCSHSSAVAITGGHTSVLQRTSNNSTAKVREAVGGICTHPHTHTVTHHKPLAALVPGGCKCDDLHPRMDSLHTHADTRVRHTAG